MDMGILEATVTLLASADLEASSDRELVDLMRGLEELKAAAASVQARAAGTVRAREIAVRGDAWEASTTRSVGAQVGLARQESPHRGQELTRFAAGLRSMPCLGEAFRFGKINERRAMIIAAETADLPEDLRAVADERLAGDITVLDGLGDLKVRDAVRREVYRLDPDSVMRRREMARKGRSVSCRRGYAADGMAGISGWVDDIAAASIMTSLHEAAASILARREMHDPDDVRTRMQVMADVFVSRLTNQPTAKASPVAVKVVISAEALLGGDDEPAEVGHLGPVPAEVARRLVKECPEVGSSVQRLFRFPETDTLVAMESTQRAFTGQLRAFVLLRDQGTCRTPYCNAPAVQVDHPEPAARGGPTSAVNGQGLCAGCNYTKEHPGWRHRPLSSDGDPGPHTVEITTPTGHVHHSGAPDLPGEPRRVTFPLDVFWPCNHPDAHAG